jgi:hypothetical protein
MMNVKLPAGCALLIQSGALMVSFIYKVGVCSANLAGHTLAGTYICPMLSKPKTAVH